MKAEDLKHYFVIVYSSFLKVIKDSYVKQIQFTDVLNYFDNRVCGIPENLWDRRWYRGRRIEKREHVYELKCDAIVFSTSTELNNKEDRLLNAPNSFKALEYHAYLAQVKLHVIVLLQP